MHRSLFALTVLLIGTADPADRPATLAVPAAAAVRRTVMIQGRVTDSLGAPIPDVQVYIPAGSIAGGPIGALSRATGVYAILAPDVLIGHEVTIRFEKLGFATVDRRITLAADSNKVDVVLARAALGLDEIVVTGIAGAAKRRELGAAASLAGMGAARPAQLPAGIPHNTENYARIEENAFLEARGTPVSTFSIDVDRASYANVRRFIRGGQRPPIDAVRIEELINYFSYADPTPRGSEPFSVTTEVAPAPWQPLHKLVRIALRARSVEVESLPPNNLVFLIDVSGSMQSPDKLPLVKTSLRMLVDQMRPQDRVALVVYAGRAGLVLPPTSGGEKQTIIQAIEQLEAGGSTAGGAGIRLAYAVAAEHHMVEGNNRVILATDGDFNVGVSSDAEMTRLVEEKRAQGTYLTVLGFGTGNLQDAKMEQMADHGNGNFAYIDSELEAKKALVAEMGGTLLTVANDVKIQVEFNPTRVASYRLIGYENRLLANQDFNDDRKDAGEIGAGHSVVALYEVIPVGVESPTPVGNVDPLRYQTSGLSQQGQSGELLFVKLRYKQPGEDVSRLITHAVAAETRAPSTDFRFAAAVAAWGMLLRDSEHVGRYTLADVADLARGALGPDAGGYRAEFLELVNEVRTKEMLSARPSPR